jgi:hypothetical protein
MRLQLGRELLELITPAPEVALYASRASTPILLSRTDTAIASQLKQLNSKMA